MKDSAVICHQARELPSHSMLTTEGRRADTMLVSSDNPHKPQNITNHYAQDQSNSARFYDSALQKVAINGCVRAAITDGSFTILMCFGRDLMVTRDLDASVAQLLRNIRI
jgi:hypothetical protein